MGFKMFLLSLHSLIPLHLETIVCMNWVIWYWLRHNMCPSLWSVLIHISCVFGKTVYSGVVRWVFSVFSEILLVHQAVQIFYTHSEFRLCALWALYVPLHLEIGLLQTNFNCEGETILKEAKLLLRKFQFYLSIFFSLSLILAFP